MLMMLAALVAEEPQQQPAPAPPPHTYLRAAEARQGCAPGGDPREIVVCGARAGGEAYRLRPLEHDDRYAAEPLRAQTGLAGGTLSVHNEAKGIGGFQSNRAMITLSLPIR